MTEPVDQTTQPRTVLEQAVTDQIRNAYHAYALARCVREGGLEALVEENIRLERMNALLWHLVRDLTRAAQKVVTANRDAECANHG